MGKLAIHAELGYLVAIESRDLLKLHIFETRKKDILDKAVFLNHCSHNHTGLTQNDAVQPSCLLWRLK